ncbi:phosphoenolpyruvate hydrolase family protein [Methylobacterium sp. NEAU 140]|uniref:phosphoenolpyruvate hydrolase family protein n=1 Tax=Methylobacterium sp. NEAU 140 TaxID=3064945 RepID=UPI0027327F13|nr:phosphoenolpyruvate hydrolase family protein [Methylobacterium sp. NEAU 140]MDP4026458.1 phosphoenolpyruvate hydrolase family protein [Methylobacterium sp. NEAU 140]
MTDLLVGAAIGLGMTARAAAQGGADFLLALNAGRLRVMGAPSVAALFPIREANGFTDAFARSEILDRVSVPVFFGAAAFDPRLDVEALAARLARAGYAGVANFPTAIHFEGRFRKALEEAGLGFAREIALLRAARAAGLATFGYAKTREEIEGLLSAEVDILCLNFGWNAGGSLGIDGVPLDEAADRARRVFQWVRQARPDTICVVEGGPIVDSAGMIRVCDEAKADGYVGGSTLDRLPLEMSVMQTTSSFKTASLLRPVRDEAQREHARITALAGLVGQSEAVTRMVERIARLVATDLAMLVLGEPGSGRTTVARAVHVASRRAGSFFVLDAADPGIAEALFGDAVRRPGALDAEDATVVVENIGELSAALQDRLARTLEQAIVGRFGRGDRRRARLVVTATNCNGLTPALLARVEAGRIDVPPLRDRPEDIPLLARAMLRGLVRREPGQGSPGIEPAVYRLLMTRDWPGNLRELRSLLARAASESPDGTIHSACIARLCQAQGEARPEPLADERAWIVDALRRNRFRRAETAAFLGLSRKTLYNKMRLYGLTEGGARRS